MYRVQYFCPSEGPGWRDVTEPVLLFLKQTKWFPSFAEARDTCDTLGIYRYHATRVLDQWGNLRYSVGNTENSPYGVARQVYGF